MTRTLHMIIFLVIFAILLVLSHIYLFARISHYLQLSYSQRRCVAFMLGAFAILTLVALPLSRILPREAATILVRLL